MRRPARAVWLWTAALIVALTTALVVASDLAALHRRARELGPERPVVVATRDLQLGATVRSTDVEVVRRHDSQVPEGALADAADTVGRTVAVPVLDGLLLTERNLVDADREGDGAIVPRGMRAVRVPDADGLAPAPGSVVDVIVALDPVLAEEAGTPTLVPAAGARVLAAPASTDVEEGAGDASVLVLVPADEAEGIAFAVANGSVTLALAPPEDACCVTSSSASSRG
jgi:Flp pilus assembly protein CpaB